MSIKKCIIEWYGDTRLYIRYHRKNYGRLYCACGSSPRAERTKNRCSSFSSDEMGEN